MPRTCILPGRPSRWPLPKLPASLALSLAFAAAGARAQTLPFGLEPDAVDAEVFYVADGVEAARYPATFPYESDLVVPAAQLLGHDYWPMLDPARNDVGGYAAISLEHCNPFAFAPAGLFAGGYSKCGRVFSRVFYQQWGWGYTALVPFNCTKSARMRGPHRGTLGSLPHVCDPRACCAHLHGFPTLGEEWEQQQGKWDVRVQQYGCRWLSEDLYCLLLLFMASWCAEYYSEGGAVRPFRFPCMNLLYYFLMQCGELRVLGAKALVTALAIEPAQYLEWISPSEANTVLAVYYFNDRVCQPASELHPDLFSTDTDAPRAAATAPPASPPPPAPSTASTRILPLFVFGIMFIGRLY